MGSTGLPQDLLLIQGFVDVIPTFTASADKASTIQPTDQVNVHVPNSDSEDDLEERAVVKLIVDTDEDDDNSSLVSPDISSSESDSSSEDEAKMELGKSGPTGIKDVDVEDDEEENGANTPITGYLSTKNEIVEANITIPDITQVSPEEELERVGKIISVMGSTAIVEGLESRSTGRGLDRALDSETLLVFEDRQVFGYIYETFGPTSHPLYQVKFSDTYPLNPQKVYENRPVFHVPQRSRFVFLSQIRNLKGSDASNVNDEEPAPEELEFSDDEAEAAHKLQLKRLRRAGSLGSSRHTTPLPSQLHNDAGRQNNYTAQDIYDTDHAGPSRPLPIPYDDPYAEPYLPYDTAEHTEISTTSERSNGPTAPIRPQRLSRGRGRGGRLDRAIRGRRGRYDQPQRAHPSYTDNNFVSPDGATYHDASGIGVSSSIAQYPQQGNCPQNNSEVWGQHQNGAVSAPFYQSNQPVQPHINPRFASALGFDIWQQGNPPESGYEVPGQHPPGPGWTNHWRP